MGPRLVGRNVTPQSDIRVAPAGPSQPVSVMLASPMGELCRPFLFCPLGTSTRRHCPARGRRHPRRLRFEPRLRKPWHPERALPAAVTSVAFPLLLLLLLYCSASVSSRLCAPRSCRLGPWSRLPVSVALVHPTFYFSAPSSFASISPGSWSFVWSAGVQLLREWRCARPATGPAMCRGWHLEE